MENNPLPKKISMEEVRGHNRHSDKDPLILAFRSSFLTHQNQVTFANLASALFIEVLHGVRLSCPAHGQIFSVAG